MNDTVIRSPFDVSDLGPHLTPNDIIDIVEARLIAIGGEVQGKGEYIYPVKHYFTPGLYVREITMPEGAVLTSKIHKTEHPFVISKGKCLVYLNREDGWKELSSPYIGITKPNTRRILAILEETVWTTFHVTDLTDLLEIEDTLLESYENKLLPEGAKHPVIAVEVEESK